MFRQVAPAPCSPPLGGSDENSAVRFTPAVKYGGRENTLFRRETRCISSHPCRAHHKLKWARKGRSVIAVLYSHLPRSESNKAICAANSVARRRSAAYSNSARSTLFDRGWQQPLNCHEARPACRVKDAEGTAQPLVLDPARWLCYLARPQAVPVAAKSKILPERMVLPSQHMSRRSRSEISTAMLASNPRLNPSKAPAEAFLIQPLL